MQVLFLASATCPLLQIMSDRLAGFLNLHTVQCSCWICDSLGRQADYIFAKETDKQTGFMPISRFFRQVRLLSPVLIPPLNPKSALLSENQPENSLFINLSQFYSEKPDSDPNFWRQVVPRQD